MPIINQIQMSEIIPEKQSQINCEIVLENNKMNSSKHVDQKNGEIKKMNLNHSKMPNNHDKTNKQNYDGIPLEITNKNMKKQNNHKQNGPIKEISYESPQKSVSFVTLN